MSFTLIVLGAIVAALLLLLAWALRGSGKLARTEKVASALEESGGVHVNYLKQIQQALSREDEEYLAGTGVNSLQRRVRRERRRVALSYLAALRQDFEKLLRTARAIAALSPHIGVAQEFERMRLTVIFHWRYRIIRMSLWAGYTPLPRMSNLSDFLSEYDVRLEAAIKELGERAVLMGEMVSSLDRRRVNPV